MATKTKPDVKVLKGQEAEDKVLEYVKRMNRPYGAIDVSANLKGAVPKTATQKILVALAEKGELVMKIYGKSSFFVANQATKACLSSEEIAAAETEQKDLEEENKVLQAQVKSLTSELAKLKATPTNDEIGSQISSTAERITQANAALAPLRAGAPKISASELAQLDEDWTKWRAQWVRRRKVFTVLWDLCRDPITPQEALELAEDQGIEIDTKEHEALEKGELCLPAGKGVKRKRA